MAYIPYNIFFMYNPSKYHYCTDKAQHYSAPQRPAGDTSRDDTGSLDNHAADAGAPRPVRYTFEYVPQGNALYLMPA